MSYSKYQYANRATWQVRSVYFLGIACWLSLVYGFFRFFLLDKWLFLILGPLLLFSTCYYLTSYGINLFYKRFNHENHKEVVSKFWEGKSVENLPTVDVFLPVCGEDISVLKNVWDHVHNIDYPKQKISTYVLDDHQERPEVEELAKSFGFKYLARSNKGELKKAGNLKYGAEKSSGQFIVIFDADCAPHIDFLKELLPYMDDKKTAIVQSPQYNSVTKKTHLKSALEFGAGSVQEDFYNIIMRSRDYFGAAICVGTNAIYRRSALNKVGGTYQIEHSEDVHTGFSLLRNGFRVKYIPIIVAIGLCPDSQHSYFKQQFRWCSGSMSLLTSGLLLSKNKYVNWKQKLCYLSGIMYYINHALTLIWPFNLFILLTWFYGNINLVHAIPFIPFVVYSFIVLPTFRITKPRIGTYVAFATYSWSYAIAVWVNLLGGKLEWSPSHAEHHSSWSKTYHRLVLLSTIYWTVYASFVGIFIAVHRFPIRHYIYFSVLFWAIYNLFFTGLFVYENYKEMYIVRKHGVLKNDESYRNFAFWRLRTAGIFILFVVVLISLTTYGRYQKNLTIWMNSHFQTTPKVALINNTHTRHVISYITNK